MNPWFLPPAAMAVAVLAQFWSRRCRSRQITARLMRPRPVSCRRWSDRGLRAITRWCGRLERPPSMADDVGPTLDELARAIGAGTSLAGALEALGPPGRPRPFAAILAGSLAQHRLGTPLADALADSAAASPMNGSAHVAPEPRLGMAVLELAARHGGTTAASLDRVAAAVRERRAVVAERAVQSAQARMSALVLTLLPIAFAAWTTTTDGQVSRFLLGTPLGWTCLGAGLGLNLIGWAWMRRLIRGRP